MKRRAGAVSTETIQKCILALRGVKVLLDADLANLYGVSTKALNQAVKRNWKRFPADFVFQLTESEKAEVVTNCDHLSRLKFAAALPYAFTEQGAIMAANVLNSRKAVAMSVFVVRAFVKMREILGATGDLARQLKDLESKLTSRLDIHETAIVEVLQRIMDILKPAPEPPEPPRKEMGFHIKEGALPYRIQRRTGSDLTPEKWT